MALGSPVAAVGSPRRRLRDRLADAVGAARDRALERAPWLGVPSLLGYAVALVGLAALVAGLVGQWVELTLLGAGWLVVTVVAVGWTLARVRYAASIELESQRVVVGSRAWGAVVVRNEVGRASLPTTVSLPVGSSSASFRVSGLGRGEEHREVFSVPARRRGVVTLGPVVAVHGDPLGLLRREQPWSEPVDLFIHPRTVPLDADTSGFLRDIEGVTTQDLSSSDVSFHALRDYVPGDDRRSVHWRTTARVGRLIVRQFEETRRSHLLVMLSLRPEEYADPEDLETAVSVAGSLALHALREEREVSVVTQRGRLSFGSGPGLLDRLAAVEALPGAHGVIDLVGQAVGAVPAASVAALVTGAAVQARELHAASRQLPLDVRAFAVRCDGTRALTRNRVGSLAVLDVGTVEDLPAGMRGLR
ncbi:DUF58 domain-containing protein [Nocardioides sp.]|uniref:DUF58 domain-containing protein n=1 Tax=Nocardioides sp. TaxID=35761 RepID=UPI0035283D21